MNFKYKIRNLNLIIPAQNATMTPPLGPNLSQHGINTMEFCKQFNEKTKEIEENSLLLVHLNLYNDKSFDFFIKKPLTSFLIYLISKEINEEFKKELENLFKIKEKLKVKVKVSKAKFKNKGKEVKLIDLVRECTSKELFKVAYIKNNYNYINIFKIFKEILGTAFSMGIYLENSLNYLNLNNLKKQKQDKVINYNIYNPIISNIYSEYININYLKNKKNIILK